MRKLKFRAWSEEANSFECFDLYKGTECGLTNLQIWARNTQIEQYTGLKDKNGKEIYEGDIVKLGKDIYEVLFDSYGQFCIENKKLHWTKDSFSFNSIDVWDSKRDELLVEVIGNIHENPELLGKERK